MTEDKKDVSVMVLKTISPAMYTAIVIQNCSLNHELKWRFLRFDYSQVLPEPYKNV